VRSPGVRPAAFLVSIVVHSVLAYGLLTIRPVERERPWPMAGVLVPGSGYSTDRSTVVFIEEEATATELDRPAPPTLDSTGVLQLHLHAHLPEVPDISEIDDASGTANAAEPTAMEGTDSAVLLTRYVGQIRARIERAWERARSDELMHCRVQISQNADGELIDLQVLDCMLDAATREALIAAIRRASPFPAPPDARLFLPLITLDFGAG
jgi:hypothetical protein